MFLDLQGHLGGVVGMIVLDLGQTLRPDLGSFFDTCSLQVRPLVHASHIPHSTRAFTLSRHLPRVHRRIALSYAFVVVICALILAFTRLSVSHVPLRTFAYGYIVAQCLVATHANLSILTEMGLAPLCRVCRCLIVIQMHVA